MQNQEIEWLDHVRTQSLCSTGSDESISWSAYHAEKISHGTKQFSSTLLPLFEDSAHLLAMVRHSMKIVQNAMKFINSDQIPVLTCDQSLFAMAKEIQWTWPVELGENYFVVMLGGLHIEITAFKTLGSWLNGSGWVDALTQSMVAKAGTTDSYLHCSHLTRARYAHQVTSVALHMLQRMHLRSTHPQ